MPTVEARPFYDQFANKLVRDFLVGNRRMEAAITFAGEYLVRTRRKAILDLGCGIGWSTYEFSQFCPHSVIHGLDLSPKLVAIAQRMFPENERRRFFCGDLTARVWSESMREEKYDACVMLDVYEHIPRASRATFHVALGSLLTPDAVMILTCPTPLHQQYLRVRYPDRLQPVDEDVCLAEVQQLAADISARIVHFEYKGIWRQNDYFHAALRRNVTLEEKPANSLIPELLAKSARWKHVQRAADLLDKDALIQPRPLVTSLLRRLWHLVRIRGA